MDAEIDAEIATLEKRLEYWRVMPREELMADCLKLFGQVRRLKSRLSLLEARILLFERLLAQERNAISRALEVIEE